MHSDNNLVLCSVIFYSLAKFLEKQHILNDPKWPPFAQNARKLLKDALDAANTAPTTESTEKLAGALVGLVSQCDEVSELLGRFHVSVTEKARVRIATDFYARGASLGAASQLAGADKSSVLNYIGATRITDKYETIRVSTRIKSAQQLFLAQAKS